jgi:micrococcal nuclease
MIEAIVQWFRQGRAGASALGVVLILLLTLSGCSGAENDTGGSEPGSNQAEATQQTTVEETTTPPTTSAPEEQRTSEEAGEERDRQGSSDDSAAASQQQPQQGSQAPPPERPDSNQEPSPENSGSNEQVSEANEGPGQNTGLVSRGRVVTVSRVVDGDTIEVSPAVDGIEDIRLIGVDTPETYGGEEPLGPQATTFTTEALEGREVALEFGEERVDPYGRVLAYVWVTGEDMFNSQLLREGLAQVATFPPNTEYVDRFEGIQADARAAGIGIWGLSQAEQCQLADRDNGIGEGSPGCTGASEPEPTPQPEPGPVPEPAPPAGGGSVPPVSENDCPSSYPIKGNEDSGIYHPPSGGSYDVTNPEVCFASGGAAEAAGYRAAQN